MNNTFTNKFKFLTLIKFALPNIVMMCFLSLYTIVDGIFVSRFLGTTALSAVNMVYPVISIQMAISIMLASGGSAIIAKKLGEGKTNEARENFSLLVIVEIIFSLIVVIIGVVFIDSILNVLGANKEQYNWCYDYGIILFAFAPAFFLQTAFQTLFVTAGKPGLGLLVTVIGGVANIVLDYLFINIFGMGISGAAVATGIGYCIPAIAGLIFFGFLRNKQLYIVKPKFDYKMLIDTCSNGSSEMVTNLANAITTFLFNYTFMKYFGVDGVASITIVLYFQFIFTAIYFGYSMGVAPIISFKYGCDDEKQLKSIFKYSMVFIGISAVVMFLSSKLLLNPILGIFTEIGSNVFKITADGFPIYAISFLFMGVSIFASAMFTAFSDGKVSAIISFARTFIFLIGAIIFVPLAIGNIGVWLAVPLAEFMGVVITCYYLVKKSVKYKY